MTVDEIQKKTGLTIPQDKCTVGYMVGDEQVILINNPLAPHCFKLSD